MSARCAVTEASERDAARARVGPLALMLLGLLSVYRAVISPLLGPSCRFEPS